MGFYRVNVSWVRFVVALLTAENNPFTPHHDMENRPVSDVMPAPGQSLFNYWRFSEPEGNVPRTTLKNLHLAHVQRA
jgi:hypothetical protein